MAQNMAIWTLFPVYVHVCVRENFQYSHQNDHFDSEVALLLIPETLIDWNAETLK